jgi:DNA-binding transcriptional MerR regulator/methylmalonyl-CoA mutase cobalamin-binding subunit
MEKHHYHPIAVVSRRTGLSAHVIRAWEKRYGVVEPARTEGNHRLYTDDDVERLLLLKDAVRTGRSIGQIAGFGNEELRELIASSSMEHEFVFRQDHNPERNIIISENYLRECMDAVKQLDSRRLSETLDRGSVALGHIAVIEQVVIPLMKEIGDFWNEGSIRILHEHMASAVVRTFLGDLLRALDSSREAPRGISTTLSGDRHELGALTAAVAAALEGWHVEYLGPNLPWEEIAQAAELSHARVIMISIVLYTDEGKVLSDIDRLRSFLPSHATILVGGHLPLVLKQQLNKPGVEWTDTIQDLRLRLHSLYKNPASSQ